MEKIHIARFSYVRLILTIRMHFPALNQGKCAMNQGFTVTEDFAWFSSACSHMGQQTNTNMFLFELFTHDRGPFHA